VKIITTATRIGMTVC